MLYNECIIECGNSNVVEDSILKNISWEIILMKNLNLKLFQFFTILILLRALSFIYFSIYPFNHSLFENSQSFKLSLVCRH